MSVVDPLGRIVLRQEVAETTERMMVNVTNWMPSLHSVSITLADGLRQTKSLLVQKEKGRHAGTLLMLMVRFARICGFTKNRRVLT